MEKSQFIYLLIEGEVKTSKTVSLFKEDPNLLYERVIRSQRGYLNENVLEVEYVNFERVYNYSAQTQKMELGIISPVAIFG